MNWQSIKVSADNTHFLFEEKPVFNKVFIEVLKFHEPGIAPVVDSTGAYHIDINGEAVYSERYLKTFGYYCCRSAVSSESGWFHIDQMGLALYKDRYDWCGNFQEDICVVRTANGCYQHIDVNGNNISKEEYIYAGDFKDSIACVKNTKGWTHITKSQKLVHGIYFSGLGIFHKGFATAMDETGWFHIDSKGRALYPQRFQLVEPFYNGVSLVLSKAGEWQLLKLTEINGELKVIVE